MFVKNEGYRRSAKARALDICSPLGPAVLLGLVDIVGFQETALAWVRGEVNLTQIARALGLDNTGYRTYSILALSLKHYLNKSNKPVKK